jgi:hypothetical protein
MAAKYVVTSEPGTYIAGIGFVKVGDIYTAPAGHIPSRTAFPLNAEAAAELKKIKAKLQADAKDVLADASGGDDAEKKAARQRAKVLEGLAKAVRTEPVQLQAEAPVVEEGLTLEQLDNIKGGDPSQAPGEKPAPGEKQDRKL